MFIIIIGDFGLQHYYHVMYYFREPIGAIPCLVRIKVRQSKYCRARLPLVVIGCKYYYYYYWKVFGETENLVCFLKFFQIL